LKLSPILFFFQAGTDICIVGIVTILLTFTIHNCMISIHSCPLGFWFLLFLTILSWLQKNLKRFLEMEYGSISGRLCSWLGYKICCEICWTWSYGHHFSLMFNYTAELLADFLLFVLAYIITSLIKALYLSSLFC
jgi:hypothetical protein